MSGSAISPSDGVHFVNLATFDDDVYDQDAKQPISYKSKSNIETSSRNQSLKVGPSTQQRMFSSTRDPIEISSRQDGTVTGMTSLPSSQFLIPELPSGKLLVINILSTWGDPHYVGLVGIDIFSRSGHLVRLSSPENQIWADPADINVLSEYGMCNWNLKNTSLLSQKTTPVRLIICSTA